MTWTTAARIAVNEIRDRRHGPLRWVTAERIIGGRLHVVLECRHVLPATFKPNGLPAQSRPRCVECRDHMTPRPPK